MRLDKSSGLTGIGTSAFVASPSHGADAMTVVGVNAAQAQADLHIV
jgi:hypothetical protein